MGGEITALGIQDASKRQFDQFPYKLINSDDISNEGFKWFMRNDLPNNLQNGCYVYNMDSKTGQGTHWTMFVIQYPDIFYVDPFGTNLNGKPPKELRTWGIQHGFKNIYCSELDIQPLKSWLCGHISIFLAKRFKPLIGSLNEQKFDNTLYNLFDDHASAGNVKIVTNWANKEGLL